MNEYSFEWIKSLTPLLVALVPLIGMAFRMRSLNGTIKQRPEIGQVDKLIELGITVVEERLLIRIRGLETRLQECEHDRERSGEQNSRLVQANTRLVERIERLLAKGSL